MKDNFNRSQAVSFIANNAIRPGVPSTFAGHSPPRRIFDMLRPYESKNPYAFRSTDSAVVVCLRSLGWRKIPRQ
jgi:hypothetical protein